MKRSYLAILIALALLLSARRSANSEPRSEKHTSKVEATNNRNKSGSSPVATSVNQGTAEKGNDHSSGETYNYSGTFNYAPPAPSPESEWAIAGEIASVASAILVAIFTALLWYVSRQQKELMKVAEDISRQSVEITQLAYLASGPYVFADDFILKNFTTRNRLPDDAAALTFMVATFQLRNVGQGPAIITIARAKLKILPDDPTNRKLLSNPSDDWGDLNDCVSIPLSARVIPAEKSIIASTGFGALPSEEDYRAISMTYDKHIVVYGLLEYIDAGGQTYKGGFGVLYRPKRMFGDDDFFTTGPIKYNQLRQFCRIPARHIGQHHARTDHNPGLSEPE